ncbi:HDOD domain-containing protein [Sporolactobacillus shoreicorticis]|uniref:EAL and HDOD domain-containing protein n=1 Tax=Sporolactobacillus shoreicorticis TaxID=1923877 RepID=A0ABW5S472_9BACL|nr:HDOD domain-containing protein [Sporolactobacillus shoreicorticis]MCO7124528.1 HDOD domain-containing protein [Sporolactobacillus shoreicorticis]
MDVYVARQPIFDRKINLYGYELLYRKSMNNYFEGTDDNQATAALLSNSILVMNFDQLIDGTRGFINFSENFLTNDFPRLLPPNKIIVEILENVPLTQAVIDACKRLKKDGYILALDDFTFDPKMMRSPLMSLADIIKIEFNRHALHKQIRLIKKYGQQKVFLAEKIETEKEYNTALRVGYHLFQGYFFSKPAMLNGTDIPSFNHHVLHIIKELKKKDVNLRSLSKHFQHDLGLAYKIMRIANTLHYGAMIPVRSIQNALTRIGVKDLSKWMHLFLLQELQTLPNAELIKACIIRGRMLEKLATLLNAQDEDNYCLVGLFSSIDALTNQKMETILATLPFPVDVKEALMGQENELRIHLNGVLLLEQANWTALNDYLEQSAISKRAYMEAYLDAIKWQRYLP